MIKLIYFKIGGLVEAPQMLMRCNNIDCEYVMSWDHFDDQWSNVNKPFKQLPILELDSGTHVGQSVANLNYIEGTAGISIADPAKATKARSILQSAQELFAPLNPTVNFAVGDDFETKRLAIRLNFASRLSDLKPYLNKYAGKYFIDETPRAAEFALFHHLDLCKKN